MTGETPGRPHLTQFTVTSPADGYWRVTFDNPPTNLMNATTAGDLRVVVFDSAHPDYSFARYPRTDRPAAVPRHDRAPGRGSRRDDRGDPRPDQGRRQRVRTRLRPAVRQSGEGPARSTRDRSTPRPPNATAGSTARCRTPDSTASWTRSPGVSPRSTPPRSASRKAWSTGTPGPLPRICSNPSAPASGSPRRPVSGPGSSGCAGGRPRRGPTSSGWGTTSDPKIRIVEQICETHHDSG